MWTLPLGVGGDGAALSGIVREAELVVVRRVTMSMAVSVVDQPGLEVRDRRGRHRLVLVGRADRLRDAVQRELRRCIRSDCSWLME